ncbi:RICIN domain-containing protein [Polymorphospora sp. NPDC050346]|uniref:RICIN domain-containing protein n=1 Tax=Polymorphospora sp. NPDC050346 TaxID=3155780 RepID=UPI0033C079CD
MALELPGTAGGYVLMGADRMRLIRGIGIAVAVGLAVASFAAPAQANSTTPGSAAATDAAVMATEGPYIFKNTVTGKCMDLVGTGAGSVGDTLILYTCNATTADNQLWYLDTTPNGFTIRNAKSNLCIDLEGTGPVPNGTQPIQYYCRPGDGDNQMFYFDADNLLHNLKSDKCIDVVGPGTGGNGTALVMYNCNINDDHEWLPNYPFAPSSPYGSASSSPLATGFELVRP